MINRMTFITKMILTVSIAFIITFTIVYFVVINNYKISMSNAEKAKIEVLSNTITPLIGINIEFELLDNIKDILKSVLENNKFIVSLELINKNHQSLFKFRNKINCDNPYITKAIIYDNTKNSIGYLNITYSNKPYLALIKNFNTVLIYIGLFIFIFIIVFAKYIIYLFQPLEQLTTKLENYNPKTNQDLNLKKQIQNNEFSIINDAIVTMIDKIDEHTSSLKETINKEVEKNLQKEIILFEQSKMAQMGEMIGHIAHQWRQPLSVISTIASGMQVKYELGVFDEKEIPADTKKIVDFVHYLSETIDTFRNFLKEKKELKDIIIQNEINKALDIVDATLQESDIKVNKLFNDNNLIVLNLIAGELSQVIINILNNAKDILLEKQIKDKLIIITLEQIEDKVIITIEDNGGGIPEHIMPKIFDTYFTTKDESKGTGLGLDMSYKIITESLHGKLSAININNGAKFIIELPIKQDK